MEDEYGQSQFACIVRDLQGGVVGRIEAPESGPFRVKLDPPWESIAEKINRGIQEGKHLISPDRKFRIVTGTSGPELEAVIHAIRVISRMELTVDEEKTITSNEERRRKSKQPKENQR